MTCLFPGCVSYSPPQEKDRPHEAIRFPRISSSLPCCWERSSTAPFHALAHARTQAKKTFALRCLSVLHRSTWKNTQAGSARLGTGHQLAGTPSVCLCRSSHNSEIQLRKQVSRSRYIFHACEREQVPKTTRRCLGREISDAPPLPVSGAGLSPSLPLSPCFSPHMQQTPIWMEWGSGNPTRNAAERIHALDAPAWA